MNAHVVSAEAEDLASRNSAPPAVSRRIEDGILISPIAGWSPNTVPCFPVGFGRDEFVLPEHSERLSRLANQHSRDARIWFDELPHHYYVDGVRTSGSVTGLVHEFAQEFVADDAIAGMKRSKLWPRVAYVTNDHTKIDEARIALLACSNGLSPGPLRTLSDNAVSACELGDKGTISETMVALRSSIKKMPPSSATLVSGALAAVAMRDIDIKDKWEADGAFAANLGTWMHLQAELFLNRDGCYAHSLEMRTFMAYLEQTLVPLNVRTFRTEWEIYGEEENIAGSIDFVGIKPNGHLVIVDWKRTKNLEGCMVQQFNKTMKAPLDYLDDCKGNHYKLQLNAYKFLIEKYYGYKVDEMQIACFHPDRAGDPFVVDVPLMYEAASYMMAVQRQRYGDLIVSRFESQLSKERKRDDAGAVNANRPQPPTEKHTGGKPCTVTQNISLPAPENHAMPLFYLGIPGSDKKRKFA